MVKALQIIAEKKTYLLVSCTSIVEQKAMIKKIRFSRKISLCGFFIKILLEK
jgi:hypothetical protein